VDRDTKYSTNFRQALGREGIEVIWLSPRSPNLNAHAERFVRSVRQECLANLIPIGPAMLRRSLREYVEHYHLERNHQGMDNQLLAVLHAARSNHPTRPSITPLRRAEFL